MQLPSLPREDDSYRRHGNGHWRWQDGCCAGVGVGLPAATVARRRDEADRDRRFIRRS